MRGWPALFVAAALALGGCTSTPSPSPSTESALRSTPTEVATGLQAPWSVVWWHGTALVSERDSGRILELRSDGSSRPIGTVGGVVHGGEGGLLGQAVHPGDQRLFVYSTGADGNRVQWYDVTGSAGALRLGDPVTILSGLPASGTHNGGRIAFGPDDLLYVSVGDAQQRERAQDRDYLGGKILRITDTGEVPADNPFPGSAVWSLGHRNVQGMAWAADGTMYASEFGQNTWDELNVIQKGGNYGWPLVEGRSDDDRFVDPVQQWPTDEASPSGLTIAGSTIYLANLRGERLRAVPVANPAQSQSIWTGEYGRLRDVARAPDGRLWVLTNNTDGRGEPREGDDRILSVRVG